MDFNELLNTISRDIETFNKEARSSRLLKSFKNMQANALEVVPEKINQEAPAKIQYQKPHIRKYDEKPQAKP